jgi:hypothetical protein
VPHFTPPLQLLATTIDHESTGCMNLSVHCLHITSCLHTTIHIPVHYIHETGEYIKIIYWNGKRRIANTPIRKDIDHRYLLTSFRKISASRYVHLVHTLKSSLPLSYYIYILSYSSTLNTYNNVDLYADICIDTLHSISNRIYPAKPRTCRSIRIKAGF